MKDFIKTLCLVLILLLFNKADAQSKRLKFPSDFTEIEMKTLNDEYWFQKFTTKKYRIESDCETILVNEVPNAKPQRAWMVESEFGIFLGINSGEWTGGLYKKSRQGAPNLIKDINVKFLHKNLDDEVLLFNVDNTKKSSSLEILYTDEKDMQTKTKVLSSIKDIPTSIYYDPKGTLYFTGASNLYYYKNSSTYTIFPDDVWKNINVENIFPQSESSILIGIQGGVLEINIKTKKMKLFVAKG